jgi:hypothetical protein
MQAEVDALKKQLDAVAGCVDTLQKGDHGKENAEAIDRLKTIIDGDPNSDVLGLRPRVKALETAVNILNEDKKQTASMLKGMALGLGLTGATGVGTFVTLLMQLLGGTK